MPVANATRIVALAHCIVHSRDLVTKVHPFDMFAIGAARGVAGHHDSCRRDNHQGQSGEHDADQFQGASVCHCKTSLCGRGKARPAFDTGLSFLQQFHLVNNANQIIPDAALSPRAAAAEAVEAANTVACLGMTAGWRGGHSMGSAFSRAPGRADGHHGRVGPEQQNRHIHLLIGCPHP